MHNGSTLTQTFAYMYVSKYPMNCQAVVRRYAAKTVRRHSCFGGHVVGFPWLAGGALKVSEEL